MNSLVFFSEEKTADGSVRIEGGRASYVFQFHGLKVGQDLPVAEWGGNLGRGQVQFVSPEEIRLKVRTETLPPSKIPLTLVVGVARPPTVRKIIHAATTLGAKSLHFVRSERAEKSYFDSSVLAEQEIKNEILKALEQCCDSMPLEVKIHEKFEGFWKGQRENLGPIKLIASTSSAPSLSELGMALVPGQNCALAIGPEAGWSEYEQRRFLEEGFTLFSMGPRILRAEIALTAAIALLGASLVD